MQENGIVLGTLVRPVYHVESGSLLKSLMVVTIYPRPQHTPLCVLTREILTPNATGATVSYTLISGDTFEDWKRNLGAMDSMILKPLTDLKNGQRKK